MKYVDELFPPQKSFKPPRGHKIPQTEAFAMYRAHFNGSNSFRDVHTRGIPAKAKQQSRSKVSERSTLCITRPQRKHFSQEIMQANIMNKRRKEARNSINLKLYTNYDCVNQKQRANVLGRDGYLKPKHSSVIGWNRKDIISEGVKDNFQNSFWLEQAKQETQQNSSKVTS